MKPTLFNTEMVQAILEGRKTVTRRVIKDKDIINSWDCENDGTPIAYIDQATGDSYAPTISCPYQPGDIMWVRETWTYVPDGSYVYKASVECPDAWRGTWHPSIHMPREAARLFLRVTGVRVERLQDSFTAPGDTITAIRDEGIDIGEQCRQCIEAYGNPCCNDLDPELEPDDNGEDENGGSECGMLDEVRSDFYRLWDSTIKPADRPRYGWEANPWVWAIRFEKISREEALKA